MLDSKAITKIQSIVLVALIVVGAVGGGAVYVLLSGEEQSSETIKIGVFVDLDSNSGRHSLQGVTLAAEQINAKGGILGRKLEVIDEDHNGNRDMVRYSTALTRLLTYDKVDFVIGTAPNELALQVQEIIAEQKKIFIASTGSDPGSQQVLDDYNRYKYYFSCSWNSSMIFHRMSKCLLTLREQTGFNKIGYIGEDLVWTNAIMSKLDSFLPQNGFELVYRGLFPRKTIDFSSYFAAAEAAGVEGMLTLIGTDSGIPFVKEYHNRQSPIFLFGGAIIYVSYPESYEWTDGKCEDVFVSSSPVGVGYPLTSKTIPTREVFIERWNETTRSALSYDILRFILADAIERAGTIETEAVIEALEQTSAETSNARNFVFTKSHGVMVGENPNDPEQDYMILMGFQWQDGEMVPVDPIKIMKEAGATYTYPDWPGPWDEIQ